jgi:hypothetical protein
MADMRERIAIMTMVEMATRRGGRLRPPDGRGRRRGRRLCNTGENEGDIDALHAGVVMSSQIRYDLSKIAARPCGHLPLRSTIDRRSPGDFSSAKALRRIAAAK